MNHPNARGEWLTKTLVVVLVASTIAAARIAADVAPVSARKPAPRFSLKDASGRPVSLSDLKGKVILLDFWATWCTGCKLEIPWFIEFQEKYAAKGLAAVGIAVDDEGWQAVTPYLVQHPIAYPIVLGDMDVLQKTFGLPASLPVTLLIDRGGRIAKTHPGVVEKGAFEADIRTLLGEKR